MDKDKRKIMKLSIIVPVYNVEAYVEKCLKSCLLQDFPHNRYEIIVIIDGATDNSKKVVEEIAAKDSIVHVYYQENKGLSITRNRGVALATGDYVWFVDSDDWIDENCLSDIISKMDTTQCDVMCQTKMYKEGEWNKSSNYHVDDKVATLEEYLLSESPNPAQFYIFKREFLISKKLKFKEGIKHEDSLFTPIALCLAESVAFYRKPVYHFFKRADSITTVYDPKRSEDYQYIIKELFSFMSTIKDDDLKHAFGHRIASIIKAHLYLGTFLAKPEQNKINSFYRHNKQYFQILRREKRMNSKFLYYLYAYTPLPIVGIYRIGAKLMY